MNIAAKLECPLQVVLVVLCICDGSSDALVMIIVYGGPAIALVPRSLSTSLIDPKEQRCCYGLAPAPSLALPEHVCRQLCQVALGAVHPTPLTDFFLSTCTYIIITHLPTYSSYFLMPVPR